MSIIIIITVLSIVRQCAHNLATILIFTAALGFNDCFRLQEDVVYDQEDDRLGRKVSRVVMFLLMLMMLELLDHPCLAQVNIVLQGLGTAWYSLMQRGTAWYSLVQPGRHN